MPKATASATPRRAVKVNSDRTTYAPDGSIESSYAYVSTTCEEVDGALQCREKSTNVLFKTTPKPQKVGVMLVGLGGNNGVTLSSGIIANRKGLSFMVDRKGEKQANWFGCILEVGTMKVGTDSKTGKDVFASLKDVVPLYSASDIILGGWDIHDQTLKDAAAEQKVIPFDLQRQIGDDLDFKPLKGVFRESWIAGNQNSRANWIKQGSIKEQLEELKADIQNFKETNQLDKVIVFWSGNTERFTNRIPEVHGSAAGLKKAVEENHSEIAPSCLYCMAAIESGCTFINGSPQNTLCDGLLEMADKAGTFVAGDDLKTGQTKIKSVLADWLISSGLKVRSIASYNHLGNNDGLNLNEDAQFRSKEISKSDVVDDAVKSNHNLYAEGEKPDHIVVIKYLPYVGDSKRAMDEYTSEMFLGGDNTIVLHNTCEDSLLAAPLMMDLILLAELCERVQMKIEDNADYQKMVPVLSLLSLFLKAPMAHKGHNVVNAFQAQRAALTNFIRALVGMSPDNHMRLEERFSLSD